MRAWASLGPDHQAGFITLTIGHRATDTLDELLRVVTKAFTMMVNGRMWKRYVAAGVISGFVKALETTFSRENGWHPHIHLCAFTLHYDVLLLKAARDIFDEWHRCVAIVSAKHGARRINAMPSHQDITPVDLDVDPGRLAGYLTKSGKTWTVAAEMTQWTDKDGREESFGPMQLLALAGQGDKVAAQNWQIWVKQMADRKSLVMSAGLELSLEDQVAVLPARTWFESDARDEDVRTVADFTPMEALSGVDGRLTIEEMYEDSTILRDMRDVAEAHADPLERAYALKALVEERGLPVYVAGTDMRRTRRMRRSEAAEWSRPLFADEDLGVMEEGTDDDHEMSAEVYMRIVRSVLMQEHAESFPLTRRQRSALITARVRALQEYDITSYSRPLSEMFNYRKSVEMNSR